MKYFLVLPLLLSLSCSVTTQRQKNFAAIQVGMLKSEVLDIAGTPYWSDRKKNQDRWFYYINPEDKDTERVVYFRHNKVIQKGLRQKSLLTAEEMEQVKVEPTQPKSHQPSISDQELRQMIRKEIKKQDKKKKNDNFEKI